MHLFTMPAGRRLLALASLLVLGACSKKEDGAAPLAPTTYESGYTVDNQNFTATNSIGLVNGTTLSLALIQTVNSTDSYTINMSVPAGTGTYNLGSGGNPAVYGTSVSGTATAYTATSGTVMVTTLSATEIIGTFSFTASNFASPLVLKTITNGKFAIKR